MATLGEFKNGKWDGFGAIFYTYYKEEGNYKNGKKHGIIKKIYLDSKNFPDNSKELVDTAASKWYCNKGYRKTDKGTCILYQKKLLKMK